MAYGTFTLTGKRTTPSGKAHTGTVTVTPNCEINDAAGDVVMSGSEMVKLAADGSWSIVLPCDSPGLNPSTGIGYTINYALHATGVRAKSFLATADRAGTTLDESQIVTVSIPTPLSAIVGPAGPANSLTLGTVTTGAAGSAASASITGAAPNQTLSLVIPKGDPGNPSPSPIAYDTDGTPYLL